MSEVAELLKTLVAIDSTSARSNQPMIDVLEPRLVALGFATRRQRYAGEGGVEKHNLIATAGTGAAELALVGHTDCVPFDPAWTEALTLTERDGKLYGRGSCDTKAFIAAALTALGRVKKNLSRPVAVVFTADEEIGCVGAKHLLEGRELNAKRAIVGEPTSLTPVRANKGYCLAEVEVFGKEGHSAYPDSGVSANFHAARLIGEIEAFALGELRTKVDAAFEPPWTSINVGVIAGGKAKNIIPGHCRFSLEWRPVPSQPVDLVMNAIEERCRALAAKDPRFKARVTRLRTDPGYDTRPDADVVAFLEGASGHKAKTVAFGTEGPQMQALGATPVVFGPGDISTAHQTGEFVPVQELHRCVEILEQALRHFAA